MQGAGLLVAQGTPVGQPGKVKPRTAAEDAAARGFIEGASRKTHAKYNRHVSEMAAGFGF